MLEYFLYAFFNTTGYTVQYWIPLQIQIEKSLIYSKKLLNYIINNYKHSVYEQVFKLNNVGISIPCLCYWVKFLHIACTGPIIFKTVKTYRQSPFWNKQLPSFNKREG